MKRILESLVLALLTAGAVQAALVAEWKFDDASGTIAVDSVGGFNGTVAESTEWVTGGVSGGALNFANNNEVVIPTGAFDSISNQVTVSMWIFGTDQQPVRDLCFVANTAGGGKVVSTHLPYSNNSLYFDAGNDTGYDRISKAAPDTTIYKGRWNHWVLTKDAVSGVMSMYVNGALFHTDSGKTKPMTDVASIFIGSGGGADYYQGLMDEVRLYDTAFSAAEVSALFDSYGHELQNIPPVADPISVLANENTPKNFALSGSDPEGSNVTYTIVSQPSFGTLQVNGALPDLIYTPNTDYVGADSFTYTVNDGEDDSDPAAVSIAVQPKTYWNDAQILTGDSDVSTNGTALFAAAFTTVGDTTVNGVVFQGGGSDNQIKYSGYYGDDLSYRVERYSPTAFTRTENPFGSLSEEYKTLLQSGVYQSVAEGLEETFTLGNLTPGYTYEVQIWIQDPRGSSDATFYGRYSTVDDTKDLDYNTQNTYGGLGQYAIGTFTAASTTQNFTLVAKNDSSETNLGIQLNALQLRLLEVPGIVGDISIDVLSGSTNVTLSWATTSDKLYGVESTDDLAFGDWSNIISNVPGNGAEVTVTNAISTDVEFYRAYLQD